ncbi:MAG: thioredoxin domain-containing protein [Actinomycetota bacterium]|nr:thioredoxin domain-containing protein [Actinomycetota bacterium]
MPNRLAEETSPYLLQHQDNPVDWYPWGPEALERARAEDRPILLSVGYAACHWCHVMEHESFEDPATARLMNESFVCVKVDREERPDIDAIYMEAVQTMTGHGGWPMTVFLTPGGMPFYGGTYFPPTARHGLPSFQELLRAINDAWRSRRAEVEQQGNQLLDHLDVTQRLRPSQDVITDQVLHEAFRSLRGTFDPTYGGFGGAPKFPQPSIVDFLLRMTRRGYADAASMATRTLDAMAAGGMFDQLAGGFARYSVDRAWIVPHFEKMLYDNAQLLRTYARSWQETRSDRHREVAAATAEWMLAEMRDDAGGFWSSLDADSEGEEGRFYVWSLDEVQEVAGDLAEIAVARWGFTAEGNFEGKNIPVHVDAPLDPDAVETARLRLLERRAQRIRPGTDSKVITSWNGLTIAALAEAGSALAHPEWVGAAREAMRFVLTTLVVNGRLMRSYRSGTVKHMGFCEDYAAVLEGCLALFEATGETEWLEHARWAADEAVRLFWDDSTGSFFSTGVDAERLVTRPKDLFDGPIPAANSVMALELQRLALLTGEASYEQRALGPIRLMKDSAAQQPYGFGHLLGAIDFYTGTPLEIVVVEGEAADTDSLLQVVRDRYLPNKVVVTAPEDATDLYERIPLLANRTRKDGRATAYVCRNGTCRTPVTEPDELRAQLGAPEEP